MAQKFGCGKKSWIGSAVHFNVEVGVGRVCLVGVCFLYRTVSFGVCERGSAVPFTSKVFVEEFCRGKD